MTSRVTYASWAALSFAALACEDSLKLPLPPASSSAISAATVPLTSDLRGFSGWSVSGGESVTLAPYRLKGAFALGSTDPKRRSVAVHFSQSAADCREFLTSRQVSHTLVIEDPDHPKDPTSQRLAIQEADPERGVRADWLYQSTAPSQVLPHGDLSENEHLWEGSFVAAGCGRVSDPEVARDETYAQGSARAKLRLGGETIDLSSATLTDYYDPLVNVAAAGRKPLSSRTILARSPKWRLLRLSADYQYCLSRVFSWHGSAALRLDPNTNEVLALSVSSEHRRLTVKNPKVKLVWNDDGKGKYVSLAIEARGSQGGVAFSLSGTANAQRCN